MDCHYRRRENLDIKYCYSITDENLLLLLNFSPVVYNIIKEIIFKKIGRFDYESWCFAGRLWSV